MSAWSIGVAARSRKAPGAVPAEGTNDKAVQGILDRLTKWIPGDVLVLYVAAVTASSTRGSKTSLLVLVAAAVLTPLVVICAAYAKGGPTKRVWVSAILAAVAFAIWSVSVPLSWWQRLPDVQANQAIFAIGAAALGLLFGFIAEGLSRDGGA